MKILAVCQHYWPESFQITAVCEDLVRRGHSVTALVGLPNYPTGKVPPEYRGGKNRRQEKDGVSIVRVFEIGRGKSPFRLAANYYSYSLSATRAVRSLDRDYDVVFSYQLSPVMMAMPAVEYKRETGAPILMYCCDLWPESMKVMIGNRFGLLLSHYGKVSRKIYQAADILAVQSSAFGDYLCPVHGIDESKIRYVPHFSSASYLHEDFIDGGHDGVNFVFMGNIGRAQDIPCILDAVARMRHASGFVVHFVGDGSFLGRAKSMVDKMGINDRVTFHGKRPYSEMPDWYRISDACLLTLDGSTWVGATLPSKLQGYMAAGKPILAAIDGGARHVIEESGCGTCVAAGNSEGLARLMDSFIDDPERYESCGQAGRSYFSENFMREQHVDKIEGLLEELKGGRIGG